jgi:hypothetical protein
MPEMYRFALICTLLAAFLATGIAGTAAHEGHEATPDAARSGAGATAADPVIVVNDQGEEIAQVTVEEIIDPFDGYEEGYEPDRGTRYVAVRLTIEATGEDPVPVSTTDISLQDSEGFWLGNAAVTRSAEQESADPSLEDTELAPGDSVTGILTYVTFEENEVDQVFWQPSGDRLITLADLS